MSHRQHIKVGGAAPYTIAIGPGLLADGAALAAPLRGRQALPVWCSKASAARSRKSSMLARRSIRVCPSAVRRSSSTDLTSLPSCSR